MSRRQTSRRRGSPCLMLLQRTRQWPSWSRDLDTGQLRTGAEQTRLHVEIVDCRVRRTGLLVVKVRSRDGGSGLLADSEPGLGYGAEREIIGCAGATHFRRDPAGFERIRARRWPQSGQRERQGYLEELRVRVRMMAVPGPIGPLQVLEIRTSAQMQPGAHVDHRSRAADL